MIVGVSESLSGIIKLIKYNYFRKDIAAFIKTL